VRGPFDERSSRHLMVTQQLQARDIDDERVLAAMRAVPRELFVPDELRRRAYEDAALPIGEGQTISQPYMVAAILQALALNGRERVLDVGTGSGYQAAVLAEIAAKVYSIEIIESLALEARKNLQYPNIEIRVGDGYQGWAEKAPFDAIVVAATAPFIPPALVAQLKPGGRMVIPVGSASGAQVLMLVTKRADGGFDEKRVLPVRFVPLVPGK
jgi:protein-L-isoaspartate(D-aspartate) O-methyltransferase